MKMRNVLVFPAGTEIGLEIINALKYCKEVNLFAAGQNISNHAEFICPQYYVLPSIYEHNWLNNLITLCQELAIDYIFPAYDDIIVALSENRDSIPAVILCPSLEVCQITRSKSATYHQLASIIKVPKLYAINDELLTFPLFVKPDKGQGALGVKKVENRPELKIAVDSINEAIICEYLPGREFTVDCFSDREKGLLFAKARSRQRMRHGIAVNTVSEEIADVSFIAQKINQVFGFYGAWFFQLKEDKDGVLTLLEISPRIAGSMATHRVMGVNFPLLTIFEHERLPIKILINQDNIELDRALSNCYKHNIHFSTLYIDLDDTLLFNNKVNEELIKLIFQCINAHKKVKLITKHAKNLQDTLKTHRLNGLFDAIIHLNKQQNKADYITETDAIFVDDSFSERYSVSQQCHIATFDSSMIESIINQATFNRKYNDY